MIVLPCLAQSDISILEPNDFSANLIRLINGCTGN